MRDVDVIVSELAREQHGVLLRAQLHTLALPDMAIARRIEKGGLVRLTSGVYALGSSRDTFVRAATAEVLPTPAPRWHGSGRPHGGDCVGSRPTALVHPLTSSPCPRPETATNLRISSAPDR